MQEVLIWYVCVPIIWRILTDLYPQKRIFKYLFITIYFLVTVSLEGIPRLFTIKQHLKSGGTLQDFVNLQNFEELMDKHFYSFETPDDMHKFVLMACTQGLLIFINIIMLVKLMLVTLFR
ncbi:hypothetical protein HERIO_955 [Hepatospora eriocheir]|uniref:Uncharacterized protein n=1 Tax=Hepatospora eriocheir TaxID=1081669 RepID=A0A1X0QBK7_9MICR|nr:hypothetical protein HERIO_955 [Hepatospora eriocheir]